MAMEATKNPISLLQEIAMGARLPLPEYKFSCDGLQSKCVANMGDISATAVARSKKMAKNICAESILARLKTDEIVFDLKNISLNNNLNEGDLCNVNYIGKLNEYCSKSHMVAPIYNDVGQAENKFVVECKLQSHMTYGTGVLKKCAKQMAAKEMLTRVDVPGIKVGNINNIGKIDSPEVQNHIIQLYKEASAPLKYSRESLTEIAANKTDVCEHELVDQLRQMGIRYQIFQLQKHPVMLVLETAPTSSHPKYVFMHSEDTYNNTRRVLLQKSLEMIRVLFM